MLNFHFKSRVYQDLSILSWETILVAWKIHYTRPVMENCTVNLTMCPAGDLNPLILYIIGQSDRTNTKEQFGYC